MANDLVETLRRNYVPVFLAYLGQRSESALRSAYELGRNAIRDELSVLDLVQIHHSVLLDVLKQARTPEDLEDLATAAGSFFVEVLATFDMAQRALIEALRQRS